VENNVVHYSLFIVSKEKMRNFVENPKMKIIRFLRQKLDIKLIIEQTKLLREQFCIKNANLSIESPYILRLHLIN